MSLSQALARMSEIHGYKQVMLYHQHQVRSFSISDEVSLTALKQELQTLRSFELYISHREGDEVIVSGLKFAQNQFFDVAPIELANKLNHAGLLTKDMSYRRLVASLN
ncbi:MULTISPECIES: hypothetical protein [unclassified Motilimonas]|uniref:hypothetical protein n=1 Tax=Motilimonas TaxID=1914248 RepID=UPI001E533CD1|nr:MULTISPECIES: hypothetical protein [unclassified Motilimonas]MCE0558043.1 hypothetical protein [Motilimonas sp. E26]MDO6526048.1 hypothetical protein [Motilimonas sp. 1_MG-2023]